MSILQADPVGVSLLYVRRYSASRRGQVGRFGAHPRAVLRCRAAAPCSGADHRCRAFLLTPSVALSFIVPLLRDDEVASEACCPDVARRRGAP